MEEIRNQIGTLAYENYSCLSIKYQAKYNDVFKKNISYRFHYVKQNKYQNMWCYVFPDTKCPNSPNFQILKRS